MEDEPIVNSSQPQINEVKENGKKMRHLGHDYSYKKFAHSEVEKVLQRFGSTWDGIKHQDIEELQERYGRNKIMNEKSFAAATFIKSYITPFTLVLLALATISFFTEYVYAAPEEKMLLAC